jgi:hypothetical protein
MAADVVLAVPATAVSLRVVLLPRRAVQEGDYRGKHHDAKERKKRWLPKPGHFVQPAHTRVTVSRASQHRLLRSVDV